MVWFYKPEMLRMVTYCTLIALSRQNTDFEVWFVKAVTING